MSRQLFGTDGVRGVAGEYPLDGPTTYALGRALGEWVAHHGSNPQVLLGLDTRESGPWLAAQVAGGLRDAGAVPRFAGRITTPGVAHLTRTRDFVAGVMISASHNPYRDNGIKVFDHSGFKLPDEQEHRIESRIFELAAAGVEPVPAPLEVDEGLDAAYVDYLAGTCGARLEGMRLAIDCANGAASHLATELFERLGASVHAIGCEPDGRNINLNCGALHVGSLQREVVARGADAGAAFDGDADRCILVAGSGKIVDGDHVLFLIARELQQQRRLDPPVVIATVMSNLGLEVALGRIGVELVRTPVGDKYVLEEMMRRGAVIGGEQSGHVIFREFATTGDGMLTALQSLAVMRRTGRNLDELTADLEIYPQTLVNVRVKHRKPLSELASVQAAIRGAEESFGRQGRVLVRFSGTEPLARVMVEGPEPGAVAQWAGRIAEELRSELGSES